MQKLLLWLAISLALVTTVSVDADAKSKNATIKASLRPVSIMHGPALKGISYRCALGSDRRCTLEEFMSRVRVCALLVIERDRIRLERFNRDKEICTDGGADGPAKSYGIASITKSMVSMLLGKAIADRYGIRTKHAFASFLTRPVDSILPELSAGRSAGGFAGITLADLIGMRSGVRWREHGWFSDSAAFSRDVRNARAISVVDFARRYRSRRQSDRGAFFNYSALDAALAAAVAEQIVKRKRLVTQFAELWAAMGAEAPARWGIDKTGLAIGPCCFRATVGDIARLGLLALHRGRTMDGRQLIPSSWFALTTQHGPLNTEIIPTENVSFKRLAPLRYRGFWWLFPGRSDFTGVGINGQFLHIYPKRGVVIVQISDWGIWRDGDRREWESFQLHDALVDAMSVN